MLIPQIGALEPIQNQDHRIIPGCPGNPYRFIHTKCPLSLNAGWAGADDGHAVCAELVRHDDSFDQLVQTAWSVNVRAPGVVSRDPGELYSPQIDYDVLNW